MLNNIKLTVGPLIIIVLLSNLISCGEDNSVRSSDNAVTLVSPLPGKANAYGAIIRYSPDGMFLAVGEVLGDSTLVGFDIGVVYIYSKNTAGSAWNKQATLISSVPGSNYFFGNALSFSVDGRFLAVGETYAGNSLDTSVGNVQIFDKNNNWANIKTLLPNLPATDDFFGEVVSFSPDGKILAVGAPQRQHDDVQRTKFGKIDLFETSKGNWAYLSTVSSITPNLDSSFGMRFSFSADSQILAVSEMLSSTVANQFSGNVQIYRRDAVNAWIHEQTLVSPIPNAGNLFGYTLSFNAIDSSLAVGEILGDTENSINIGTVYIYIYNGKIWEATVNSPLVSNKLSSEFGTSVLFSPDGNTLAIGEALGNVQGEPEAGLVQLFRKTPNWQWYKTLQSNKPNTSNFFGLSFTFSPNSQTLAIGEVNGDDLDKADIGKVHFVNLNQ